MTSMAQRVRRHLFRALADAAPFEIVVRRGDTRNDLVALTFDDGPCDMTEAYLDALDALGLRATFFLVGAECARRPDDVLSCIARGHEVAAHGYTHTPFPMLPTAALRDELAACEGALPPSSRARPLLRPPRGYCSVRSVAVCAARGYTTVLWNVDSDDCRTRDPDVVGRRLDSVRAGDIVLLHEGQQWTIDALPSIAERLRILGLEAVTMSELLAGGPTT